MNFAHSMPAILAAAGPEGKGLIKFGYMGTEILLAGALVVAALAIPWAARASGLGRDSGFLRLFNTRLRRIIAAAAVAFVPMTLLQLDFDSAKEAKVPLAAGPATVAPFLSGAADPGAWLSGGGQWLLVLALTAATVGISVAALGRRGGGTGLLRAGAAAATLLVLAPAIPTTLAKTDAVSLLGPLASQSHILGGAVWVGGLFLLTMLLWPLPRAVATSLSGEAASFWPHLWQRFSLLATLSLGVIILSGGWLTWAHVGSIGQMFTTPYGIALTVKIRVVGAMVVFGAIHQMHLLPRIHRARAAGAEGSVFTIAVRHFRGTVLAEALLGVAVLVIVPLLSGSARKQAALAGSPAAAPVFDGGILALAAAGIGIMVLLFWASARVSARRSVAAGSPVPTQ